MALGWRKSYYRYREYFLNIYEIYKKRPDLKMFLEVLLTLATISFFLVFALRPTALAITELLEEIEAKEEIASNLDTKIQNLQSAQDNYSSEESTIELLESAVPVGPQPELAVRQFEGLTRDTGVTMLGFNIGEAVLVGTLSERQKRQNDEEPLPQDSQGITFSMSVTGQYSALENFLTKLGSMRRPIKIDSLSVTSSETSEGNTIVLVVSGRLPFIESGSQNE